MSKPLTEAEQQYNHPPMPDGPMNLWVGEPGAVPALLTQLAEGFRQMVPLGSPAPDFSGELLDGGQFHLSDQRNKKPVCIQFGSISDPPIISNANTLSNSLNALYQKYRERVTFLFIYTREAHPGSLIQPHKSMDEKRQRARQLQKQENLAMPILVDTMDGAIHQRYTPMPNSNYLITRGGTVAAKSLLLDCTVLDEALNDLVTWDRLDDGQTVVKKSYHERIHVCRAPFDPAGREKERQTLEASGPEQIEGIRRMAGFDPLTWTRA